MRDLFGLPASFISLHAMALASKLRVLAFEAREAEKMWQELQKYLFEDSFVPPLPLEWYQQCHCKVLADARSSAASLGVTHASILESLRSRAPDTDNVAKFIRSNYQGEAYAQLMRRGDNSIIVEERHRQKQKRWKLQVPARIGAVRAVGLFKRLPTLVRPRVAASIARTHWNSWCTRRRFQQEGPCVFGCSAGALDASEHYMWCPVFRDLVVNFLHLPQIASVQEFLLLDHRLWSDRRLIVAAIAVHALYTTFNHARLSGPRTNHYLLDHMQRSCYHAVANHGKSSIALTVALGNTRMWW